MDTVVVPKPPVSSKTYQGVIVALIAKAYGLLAVRYGWHPMAADDLDLLSNLVTIAGMAWAAIGLRTASRPIGDPTQPIVTPTTPVGTASGEPPAKGGIE